MRISLSWLDDVIACPPPDELARRLTMAGLEIEKIEPLHQDLEGVLVGKILESNPHPNAEKLSVTRVDVGRAEPLQIVCGAKNYKVGDKVPVATIGTSLPGGVKITQANLRGVESFGMLCSAKELSLSTDAAGLMILDPKLNVGESVASALHLADVAFEVNVTPNRADALSHLGVARDLSALLGKPLKAFVSAPVEGSQSAADAASVKIDAPERCSRYLARVIEGVKVGPSPQLIQSRLQAVGVRPINNVVDVTNYVLMELGHPLHAFDLDKLAGPVTVRLAKAGEVLKTLDGVDRKLDADDLVIADSEKAVAIAGVMGGANSEVSAGTTRILLESAHFSPQGVRRSSKRHDLHSEASHRFERGTDVEGLALALDRAAALIAEVSGGTVRKGVLEARPAPFVARKVTLRHSKVEAVLGAAVPAAESVQILERLGFGIDSSDAAQVTVKVPAFRVDVEREEDLIEEVARIRGFDQIPARIPRVAAARVGERPDRAVERRARGALSSSGLDEVVNFSFVHPDELAAVDPEGKLGAPIRVLNPLNIKQGAMRTSLLPGLLRNLVRAQKQQQDSVRLYEWGRVYRPHTQVGAETPAHESLRVAGLLAGGRHATAWTEPAAKVDFYDAKGAVEALLAALGIHAEFQPIRALWGVWHPRAAAQVVAGGAVLGAVGELHPRLQEAAYDEVENKSFALRGPVFLFDLDVAALVAQAALVPQSHELPKFPAVLRDLAVVLAEEKPASEVLAVVREAGGALVEDVLLFDVFRGQNIGPGQKSLAFAIRYRAPDRTLTDAEAVAAHERIVAAVQAKLGAALRA
jgi:phenylalanyl-tRNA synthetase beta chain